MVLQLQQRIPTGYKSSFTGLSRTKLSYSSLDRLSSLSSLPVLPHTKVKGIRSSVSVVHVLRIRNTRILRRSRCCLAVRSSAGSGTSTDVRPAKASSVSISDVLWPSAGAFLAMAVLGRMDQMMAPRGLTVSIAPLGAVSVVLFTAPNSPAAKKYNMFVAQIGCAAIGVLAFSLFGPGWIAKGAALAASIAFMIITEAAHPPAASLPLVFIDGAKFHKLQLWYALFPGLVGCLILCLIQEIVVHLKKNCKF